MRDRRQALKLLAGGTAAAVGTSIIATNRAFADGGSAPCQPQNLPGTIDAGFTITAETNPGNANDYLHLVFQPGPANLNQATCATGTRGFEYRWSIAASPSSGPGVPHRIITNGPPGGRVNVTDTWTTERNVRLVDIDRENRLTGDFNYIVDLEVRVLCVVSPTKVCWRCLTCTVELPWNFKTSPDDDLLPDSEFALVTLTTTVGSANCDDAPIPL